jgi:VanZ family protein
VVKARNKLNKYILLILIFICILFIFHNSSRDAESSKEYSMRIARAVERIVTAAYGNSPPGNITYFLRDRFDDILRNTAHVIEFMVLSILVMLYSYTFMISFWRKLSLSVLFCIFIAVVDEVVQLFSPGRAFEVCDLCLDLLGSLIGVMLVIIIYKLRKKSAT